MLLHVLIIVVIGVDKLGRRVKDIKGEGRKR